MSHRLCLENDVTSELENHTIKYELKFDLYYKLHFKIKTPKIWTFGVCRLDKTKKT